MIDATLVQLVNQLLAYRAWAERVRRAHADVEEPPVVADATLRALLDVVAYLVQEKEKGDGTRRPAEPGDEAADPRGNSE
jgi:hypothetical protein